MSKETHQSDDDDENLTTNTAERWEYLASIITGVLVLTLSILLIGSSIGVLSLSAIPQPFFLLFSSCLLTAIVWTFGEDAFKRWKSK